MSTLPSSALFAAALRRSLLRLAAWTNLIFDGDSGRRLIGQPLPPDGVLFNRNLETHRDAGSAGDVIERSIVFRTAMRAEHFVTTGEWQGTFDELRTALQSIGPFHKLLGGALIDPYGEAILEYEDEDLLRDVLNRFEARFALLFQQSLSLKELASLSGLSEKTVRMAAMGRDRNPELATYKDGTATRVTVKEAERWLRTKSSYRTTRILNRVEALDSEPANALQLAALLTTLRTRVGFSIPEVATLIGLPGEASADLETLEQAWWGSEQVNVELFDLPVLARLAQVLQVPEPTKFVRAVAALMLPYQIERQFAATTPTTERSS